MRRGPSGRCLLVEKELVSPADGPDKQNGGTPQIKVALHLYEGYEL